MPNPTPKPMKLITGHHLTKADMAFREEAEKKMSTGKSMQPTDEVKKNKIALCEFNRIKELYALIEQDDAMLSGAVNRYCILRSEEVGFLEQQKSIKKQITKVEKQLEKGEIDFASGLEMMNTLRAAFFNCDKIIMQKRKMMFEHERAMILTLSDKIRSIPKKAPEEAPTGIAAYKARRGDGG